MAAREPISFPHPLFSIVIAVCNDWVPLDECLRSLARQTGGPTFEVIVVDDGSSEAAPDFIRRWTECYPLTIIGHSHAGISIARNRGVQASKGTVLLFVDADCRFQENCLVALASKISDSPKHNYFQLHLVGDCLGTVGKAEELRLTMLQDYMLQPDGRKMPEPRMDSKAVGDAVAYMANLPLDANVLFMTVMASKMPFVGRG